MELFEIPGYINTHNSVVTKILQGRQDWSDDELQHYTNYPSNVEKAIGYFKKGVPVADDGCVFRKHTSSLFLSWLNYGAVGDQRTVYRRHNALSFLTMAFAKYCIYTGDECNVAITIVDNDCIDVGVAQVGDGVITMYGIYGGKGIPLEMACDMAWGMCADSISQIDMTFVVGNHSLKQNVKQTVENKFGTCPHCFVTYFDLLDIASDLFAELLKGNITDTLLLDVVPMPVGACVSSAEGNSDITQLIGVGDLIPLKKSAVLPIDNHKHPFQIKVFQSDFRNPSSARLWKLKTLMTFPVPDNRPKCTDIKIVIDIDAKGIFNIGIEYVNESHDGINNKKES